MLAEVLAWGFIVALYLAAVGVIALPKHWYRFAQLLLGFATVLADAKIIYWATTSSHGLKMRIAWSSASLLVTTGFAIWFILKVQGDINKEETAGPKRDFLVARLHELIKETDEFDRNEQGPLSDFHFRVGIGNKIELFLGLYSTEWVTRFRQKKALALEEIIKELLGGAPIPVLPQPTLEPRLPLAELEKEYEIKPLEPNFMDFGSDPVNAYDDGSGVIVRGESPKGDSYPVLTRSFGNEHRLKKVRPVKRVSFALSFICFDVAATHTPKNNVTIHRGAWLTEAETEIDFPANCPPRRAVIATVQGSDNQVFAVRRDSDSSYKTILPLREELTGSIYTVIISLRVESQKTASFQYILEIVRDPKVELRLNDVRSWKSTHL